MTKGKRVMLCILLPAALLLILVGWAVIRQGSDMRKLSFEPVRISSVADGIYHGTAGTLLVSADVEVTVQGGVLRDIRITRHDHGLGGPAEAITLKMLDGNTLEVDAVSGATVSSEVIRSAVSHALPQKQTGH